MPTAGENLPSPESRRSRASHAAAVARLAAVRARVETAAGLVLRGGALFVALFLVIGIVGEVRGRTLDPSLWLLDLHDVPAPARLLGLGLAAGILGTWALAPKASPARRRATAMACAVMAVLAFRDVLTFISVVGDGRAAPYVPVPLSAIIAAGLVVLGAAVVSGRPATPSSPRIAAVGLGAAVVAWAIVFPIAQMLFFGTTDYRRPADAAVVFGARVYASGVPSPLLQDRIDTAVQLYRSGLVPVLVMSGGDGADGFNEATVMRQVAIAEGVPANAVVADGMGLSTEATVDDVQRLVASGQVPLRHSALIAVSQAYHLPRVQLAFASVGIDVLTVPAHDPQLIGEMPVLIGREVLAFWAYDLRTCLG
jgi:vancomycin permeability regulator SanA